MLINAYPITIPTIPIISMRIPGAVSPATM